MLNKFFLLFKKGIKNFLENPIFFIIRQLYRVIFILPFQIIIWVVSFLKPETKLNPNQPNSFCFLVTSVIYPVMDKKITYGSVRSVFGPEDRAKQTLATIESVHVRAPGAKIVLIEAGLQGDLPLDLASKVDQYIYVGDKPLVRWACDSRFKSLGEAVMLLSARKLLTQEADFYFKLSGRYWLDEDFNLDKWKSGQFILYFLQSDYISTRLYGFRKEMLKEWKFALMRGLPFSLIGYAIENTLARFIPKKYITAIDNMGVTGISAANTVMKE